MLRPVTIFHEGGRSRNGGGVAIFLFCFVFSFGLAPNGCIFFIFQMHDIKKFWHQLNHVKGLGIGIRLSIIGIRNHCNDCNHWLSVEIILQESVSVYYCVHTLCKEIKWSNGKSTRFRVMKNRLQRFCGRVSDKRKYSPPSPPPHGTVLTAVLGLVNIGFVTWKFFFLWLEESFFTLWLSSSFALLCLFRFYISLNIFLRLAFILIKFKQAYCLKSQVFCSAYETEQISECFTFLTQSSSSRGNYFKLFWLIVLVLSIAPKHILALLLLEFSISGIIHCLPTKKDEDLVLFSAPMLSNTQESSVTCLPVLGLIPSFRLASVFCSFEVCGWLVFEIL